jgi:general secretion pathway protein I
VSARENPPHPAPAKLGFASLSLINPLLPQGRRGQGDETKGFTLIEILVAFAVATLLLGALYQIFSTGLRSSVAAENLSGAVLLAQSAIDATAGTIIAEGDTDDDIDFYHRRISIRLRPDLSGDPSKVPLAQYQIEVTVTWRDGRRARHVSLVTLRPGPMPETPRQ